MLYLWLNFMQFMVRGFLISLLLLSLLIIIMIIVTTIVVPMISSLKITIKVAIQINHASLSFSRHIPSIHLLQALGPIHGGVDVCFVARVRPTE